MWAKRARPNDAVSASKLRVPSSYSPYRDTVWSTSGFATCHMTLRSEIGTFLSTFQDLPEYKTLETGRSALRSFAFWPDCPLTTAFPRLVCLPGLAVDSHFQKARWSGVPVGGIRSLLARCIDSGQRSRAGVSPSLGACSLCRGSERRVPTAVEETHIYSKILERALPSHLNGCAVVAG